MQAIRLQFEGAFEHLDCAAVVMHLLVGAAQRRQRTLVRRLIGDAPEHLNHVLGVAYVGVDHRQAGKRILVVGIAVKRLLERLFGLNRILRDSLQPAQCQPTLDIRGIFLRDDLVLLDRLLHHLIVDLALLRIANRTGVDPSQHTPGLQVLWILLQQPLGFGDGGFQLVALDIQVGQLLEQERRRGIQLHRLLVVVDCLLVIIAAIAVVGGQLRIIMRHGEVEVGRCFILRGWRLAVSGRRIPKQNNGQGCYEYFC